MFIALATERAVAILQMSCQAILITALPDDFSKTDAGLRTREEMLRRCWRAESRSVLLFAL